MSTFPGSVTSIAVLAYVRDNPGMTKHCIVITACGPAPTRTRIGRGNIVDRLVREGYIERNSSPSARYYTHTITDNGECYLKKVGH